MGPCLLSLADLTGSERTANREGEMQGIKKGSWVGGSEALL